MSSVQSRIIPITTGYKEIKQLVKSKSSLTGEKLERATNTLISKLFKVVTSDLISGKIDETYHLGISSGIRRIINETISKEDGFVYTLTTTGGYQKRIKDIVTEWVTDYSYEGKQTLFSEIGDFRDLEVSVKTKHFKSLSKDIHFLHLEIDGEWVEGKHRSHSVLAAVKWAGKVAFKVALAVGPVRYAKFIKYAGGVFKGYRVLKKVLATERANSQLANFDEETLLKFVIDNLEELATGYLVDTLIK
jgi:hypothetical protein